MVYSNIKNISPLEVPLFSPPGKPPTLNNNFGFDEANLVVKSAFVDQGPVMKRFRPRAQGRAYRILKATSHITVIVAS